MYLPFAIIIYMTRFSFKFTANFNQSNTCNLKEQAVISIRILENNS